MSINVLRNLAQLKEECALKTITVIQSGKRESKTDYILALRDYFLNEIYGGDIPPELQLMLELESPMLCQQYKVLKPEEQDAIWHSEDWVLEQKLNGIRMVSIFCKDRENKRRHGFFSRNISVENYLPVSYTETILTEKWDMSKIKDDFILDSEIMSKNAKISTVMENRGVVTESELQAIAALLALNPTDSHRIQREVDPIKFVYFDIVYWNGEWLLDKPLWKRREYLLKALKQMLEAKVDCQLPPSRITNKKASHTALLKMGLEGSVAKNIHSPYIASNSRRRDGWVKVKRTVSESLNMEGIGDTIDGYVSGFEEADENKSWAGLVGALEISTTIRRADGTTYEHVIARVTNITMELRKKMTEVVDGKPKLKQEFYGKVAEVDGQAISARAKRLTHPVFVRWRDDKNAGQCIMDEDFLNAMIL